MRYTSTGALDTSFDGTGKVTTPIGSGDDFGSSVVVQSDGKIVVAGQSHNGSGQLCAGALHEHGGAGHQLQRHGQGDHSHRQRRRLRRQRGLQSDGKIVVAGYSNNGSDDDFALVRYTSTGALDTSFGSGGKVTTPIGSGTDDANSVALQSDGKIVAAGVSAEGGNYFFALVRYAGASYPAASVATAPATSETTTTATLNGTVNPNGIITSAWFEYGTTILYGQTTAPQAQGYGTSVSPVSAAITALTSGTLYHYRLVAQNGEVTAYGADMTFTALTNNQNWRLTYFGTSGNTGNAADTADPDGDGVSNLMEFATGSNPTSTSSPPGSGVLNGSFIEFTYTRSNAALADGVIFSVEWSDTLDAGSWSNTGVTESILSDNGTLQQVKAFVPAGGGNRRFVYMKVTSQ